NDIDIIIDLGSIKSIKKVSVNFLRDILAYIFLPEEINFSVSLDGNIFENIYTYKEENQNNNEILIKNYEVAVKEIKCRYVRLKAKNIGICPDWHIGKGDKAWLFIDEITIE
ncbi:MAG: glycoside hydrolase family 92 protein, partial [Melioribacter sp.]|nr:glycoside hydrolase family 92 protein [Melioribacter sp.]